MKFDVIIGNPPYQLNTGGAGKQARPLYHLFIEQSKKLKPRYLSMIIPSRWFSGGMGLEDFRTTMLTDHHLSNFVDYSNAKECFPENSISGGVCYFLWSRDYDGECKFTSIKNGDKKTLMRSLQEFPVLVRYNEAVEIIRKISSYSEKALSTIVSSLTPFGLPTNYRGTKSKNQQDNLILHASSGITYIPKDVVKKGLNYIGKYKVMISKTSAEHAGEPSKDGKFRVITSSMKVLNHYEVCTHSYFVVGEFEEKSLLKICMSI